MHGSNQYAANSPAVAALKKPSAPFWRRAKTKQSFTALFQKDGAVRTLLGGKDLNIIQGEQITDSSILQTQVPLV